MPDITIPICIASDDANAKATIDYNITYKGARQTYDSPAEAMEYEHHVSALEVTDNYKTTTTVWPIPDWLNRAILINYEDEIYEAISAEEGNALRHRLR
jgi:hypothetical protein